MLGKAATTPALLALLLLRLALAQGTPVTPLLEATSMEPSRDSSVQPSTGSPLDYSTEPSKAEAMGQTGNMGVQESGETTWELSGESSTDPTLDPSVEPSTEPTPVSTTGSE